MHFEKFEQNENLALFYDALKKSKETGEVYNPYALPTQLHFLQQRIRLEKAVDQQIVLEKEKNKKLLPNERRRAVHVIDRSLFEDNEIFAKNQRDSGLMNEEEYLQYLELYNKHVDEILKPDLIVYLRPSIETLQRRIKARGREMEKDLSKEYLENLQHRYDYSLEPYLKSKKISLIKCSTDEGPESHPEDRETRKIETNQKILQTIKTELELE